MKDASKPSSVQMYAMPQSEVRDNSDRMFVQEEFAAIQHLTGTQCSYDACCDGHDLPL